MYQKLKSGQITSKFLKPDVLYDITAGEHCIRISPYSGTHEFGYLRPGTACGTVCVAIPAEIRKIAKIVNKANVVQIGSDFFALHPDFRGDPYAVAYTPMPPFPFLPTPDSAFFEEADTIPADALQPMPVIRKENLVENPILPLELLARLGIKRTSPLAVTRFDVAGRRWLEIRKADGAVKHAPTLRSGRLPDRISVPGLSGITVLSRSQIGSSDGRALPANDFLFADWNVRELCAWYSTTRNAIIIERTPQQCAVCGAPIRSIAAEHHTIAACADCVPHLGKGGAVERIASAKRTIQAVKEIYGV